MVRFIKTYVISVICIISMVKPVTVFADTEILREPTSNEDQCIQWMIDHDVEQEFIDLVPYIYKTCIDVGIDPTLVIGQSALETGYFTSYTLRKYHNTAGIKDRTNTNKYAEYKTYKDGFTAQIYHLALYAGDPQEPYYYSDRLDGWVTTVEALSKTWAEDPYYSEKVLAIMSDIQKYEVKKIGNKPTNEAKEEQTIKPLDIIYHTISKNKNEKSEASKILLRYVKRRL